MACVKGLEQVEGFLAAYLTENGCVRPVAKAGFEKVPDGHGGNILSLPAAGFEADNVRLSDVYFGRVFDNHKPAIVRNEVGEDVQDCGFSGAGPAADEDVSPPKDCYLEDLGQLRGKRANAD